MDSGYVELAELNQRLAALETVTFRAALVRDGDAWRVHTLIIDHLPKQESRKVAALENYGTVQFVAGVLAGTAAVAWLHQRTGEVMPPGTSEPVRRLSLPAIVLASQPRAPGPFAPYVQ